jgi:hypothetical protein
MGIGLGNGLKPDPSRAGPFLLYAGTGFGRAADSAGEIERRPPLLQLGPAEPMQRTYTRTGGRNARNGCCLRELNESPYLLGTSLDRPIDYHNFEGGSLEHVCAKETHRAPSPTENTRWNPRK